MKKNAFTSRNRVMIMRILNFTDLLNKLSKPNKITLTTWGEKCGYY